MGFPTDENLPRHPGYIPVRFSFVAGLKIENSCQLKVHVNWKFMPIETSCFNNQAQAVVRARLERAWTLIHLLSVKLSTTLK